MSLATVWVTGGSRGIGRAIVDRLVRDGVQVAFTYCQDRAGAERLSAETAGRARAYPLDLRHPQGPDDLVARIEEDLGPVDGLVNNAGVAATGLLALTSDEAWTSVIDVNLGGTFRCCRAVLPGMVQRRTGSIVNVASLSAFRGVAGQTAYAASKAGIVGLTRALAREVGKRGVRVNAVAPGLLSTEMTASLSPAGAAGLRANESLTCGVGLDSVAESVFFLLSPGAASITGQCLLIDAGASA